MPNENENDVKNGENSENSENDNKGSSNEDNSADEQNKSNNEQSSENANNDENKEITFKDPELQKAWTQKTQKLAEERKEWESEREKSKGEVESLRKKAALLDRLDKDPDVVNFVLKKYGKKEEESKPSITTEELILAQSDPQKMSELIRREAEGLIKPIKGKLGEFEMRDTIEGYASQEGNEDFNALRKAGLIKPFILNIRAENPHLSSEELVAMAHKEARSLVNSIAKQEQDKANGNLQKKKEAIGDKGGKNSVANSQSYKGKSITEIGMEIAARQK